MIDNNLPIQFVDGGEQIVFAGNNKDEDDGHTLDGTFGLPSIVSNECEIFIDTKEDAENLIRALEKAIERGWWN